MKKDVFAFSAVIFLSALIFFFLIQIIYGERTSAIEWAFLKKIPFINCLFNTLSTISLALGFYFIKRRSFVWHGMSMVSALCFSVLFFISYSIYHYFFGDKGFTGEGWMRPLYFFILISHIVLTAIALPMILWTFTLAACRKWKKHRWWAQRTIPLWAYVSVTGILIYIFLYVLS